MKNTSIYNTLIKLAAESAGIECSKIRRHNISFSDGFCYVVLISSFHSYECIIDTASMKVEGILSEPSGEGLYDIYSHYSA